MPARFICGAVCLSFGEIRSVSIVMTSSDDVSLFGNIWFCVALLISPVSSCSSLSPDRKTGACVGDSSCSGSYCGVVARFVGGGGGGGTA